MNRQAYQPRQAIIPKGWHPFSQYGDMMGTGCTIKLYNGEKFRVYTEVYQGGRYYWLIAKSRREYWLGYGFWVGAEDISEMYCPRQAVIDVW